MRDLIIRSDGTYIEDFSGELVPVKVHYTRLDAPPSIDTDHAVALEREAIAAWHERRARAAQEHAQGLPLESNRRQLLMEDFAVHKTAALAIRNGAHHTNTPPNAQERGQDGLTGSATGVSDHDAIPVAQNAKYGLPKENK